MDLGLADRVYVLTGASRGLGFAAAEHLVADGARVVISSRDADRVAEATEKLGGAGHAAGVVADLGDPTTADRLVATAVERFGRIDGALLSVGGPPQGTALAATDEQWLTAFQTIFLGAVRAARTVAASLTDGGAIGLVLSISARTPVAGLGISNGLRPGLLGAAKDMADELAPRGIRVISLLPGILIGLGRASEFTFTNAPIPAAQALEWGLVNRVVAGDALMDKTNELAARLAQGPLGAYGLTKRAFNRAVLPNLEEALECEGQLQEVAGHTEEHREGVAAFLEKRRARFVQTL
jgi:3-oxoacyl-[acyl-carrier protein] reductase